MKKITTLVIIAILALAVSMPAFAIANEESEIVTPDGFWIRHDHNNQDATAYYSFPGQKTMSGRDYQLGYVAVHRVDGEPVIPFGTLIMLTNPSSLNVMGQSFNYFFVQDCGDDEWIHSYYFIDVYHGLYSQAVDDACRDFGVKTVSYYWEEHVN